MWQLSNREIWVKWWPSPSTLGNPFPEPCPNNLVYFTKNCISMSNFDILLNPQEFFYYQIWPRFLLTAFLFHQVHRVFIPKTITLYEWICVVNSPTAFVWRALLASYKIQYCKIGFEYITYYSIYQRATWNLFSIANIQNWICLSNFRLKLKYSINFRGVLSMYPYYCRYISSLFRALKKLSVLGMSFL